MPYTVYAKMVNFRNTKFFAELGVDTYSHTTMTLEDDYGGDHTLGKENHVNNSGFLAIGVDFDGNQIEIIPNYYETNGSINNFELNLRLDIPFRKGDFQPYATLLGGFDIIELQSYKTSLTGWTWGLGGGIKYNVDKHLFVKFGFMFQSTQFNKELKDEYGWYNDVTIFSDTFKLLTSVGYRF